MSKNETNILKGRDILAVGWAQGPAVGAAVRAAAKLADDGKQRAEILTALAQVNADPDRYLSDLVWGEAAGMLAEAIEIANNKVEIVPLRDEPAPLSVWGREMIDEGSFKQINDAARLPVTLRVALMPDAHIGYGLPIGGVAALDAAIAPYMVGVDIGCRMHATIFDRSPIHLDQDTRGYVKYLQDHTYFGRSGPPKEKRNEHEILDDPRWDDLPREFIGLKDKAAEQLGTSGGGNHFVEFTKLTVYENNPMGLEPGKYIALVSHSGSRAVGYKIANYFTQLAEQICAFLPEDVRKLAYFTHGTGPAEAYELAMNLAGDFAQANHEVIHRRITAAIGDDLAVGTIQNHHNFAWRIERDGGQPAYIHRKGATPAGAGVMGIIPGSMATPGFFVTGKGGDAATVLENKSLNSASHGSGRVLGRRQAIKKLDRNAIKAALKKKGVTLIGGGLDEAPDAYKDPRQVIAAQADLVDVWAEFMPVIVRMEAPRGKSLGNK